MKEQESYAIAETAYREAAFATYSQDVKQTLLILADTCHNLKEGVGK
jgi:hypothetical protein